MTLHEYVNRGRLFEVEPSFGDMVSYEMISSLEAAKEDMNRWGYGGEFVIPVKQRAPGPHPITHFTPGDQQRLFEAPVADGMEWLWEAVLQDRVPMWVYEDLEGQVRSGWDD